MTAEERNKRIIDVLRGWLYVPVEWEIKQSRGGIHIQPPDDCETLGSIDIFPARRAWSIWEWSWRVVDGSGMFDWPIIHWMPEDTPRRLDLNEPIVGPYKGEGWPEVLAHDIGKRIFVIRMKTPP